MGLSPLFLCEFGADQTSPAGPNEIQQLAYVDANGDPIVPDSGTYDLVFDGQTTSDLSYDAAAGDVQAALEALTTIGSGNASVSSPAAQVWYLFFSQDGDGSATFEVIVDTTTVSGLSTASTAADVQSAIGVVGISCTVTDNGSGGMPYTLMFTDSMDHAVAASDDARSSDDSSDAAPSVASGSFVIEFVGSLARAAQDLITVVNNSLGAADNTISVTTTTPGTDPDAGSSSTFTLSASETPASGTWSVGDWTGNYNDTPSPSGWTASGDLTSSVFFTSTDLGTSELGWDAGSLNSAGDGSGDAISLSDNGSFVQGDSQTDGTPQVDTIALDSAVTGRTWHIGDTTGIAFDDDGSGVQPAIESLLSISGGSIDNPSPGVWDYTYGEPGDMTGDTATLAANTAGDDLTQAVTVSIVETQAGG